MNRFYRPPLDGTEEDPFARDGDDKLIRRGYWLGLSDRSLVQLMTQGIGTRLTPDQKRAHLDDIGRAPYGGLIVRCILQQRCGIANGDERVAELMRDHRDALFVFAAAAGQTGDPLRNVDHSHTSTRRPGDVGSLAYRVQRSIGAW